MTRNDNTPGRISKDPYEINDRVSEITFTLRNKALDFYQSGAHDVLEYMVSYLNYRISLIPDEERFAEKELFFVLGEVEALLKEYPDTKPDFSSEMQ